MCRLFTKTFLSVLILGVFLQETETAKCCIAYQRRPVHCSRLRSYKLQNTIRTCDMKAIVFYTTNHKFICANPDMAWTQKRIECLMKKAEQMRE